MKTARAFDRIKNNEIVAQGYIYKVNSWKVIDSVDPWSGMPNIDTTWCYFDNAKEAMDYAKQQRHPFSGLAAKVENAEYMETWEEKEKRRIKEKEEKDAKKAAKIAEKAKAANMTIEQYTAEQKKKAAIKRYETEIQKRQKEITKMQKEIEKYENKIKEMGAN